MSRFGWLILGLVIGIVIVLPLGSYLFAKFGGIAMATTAQPLPFEKTLAKTALKSSIGDAAAMQNPVPLNDANLLAGAALYRRDCAVCHGVPGRQKTAIAAGEFPAPPQLFEKKEMVADDPQGVTYWKITHGIRLSGMPGFASTDSDTERWQITLLLANAGSLPQSALTALSETSSEPPPR